MPKINWEKAFWDLWASYKGYVKSKGEGLKEGYSTEIINRNTYRTIEDIPQKGIYWVRKGQGHVWFLAFWEDGKIVALSNPTFPNIDYREIVKKFNNELLELEIGSEVKREKGKEN